MSKTDDFKIDLASHRRIEEAHRLFDLGDEAMRRVWLNRSLSFGEKERRIKDIARQTSEAVRLAAPELDRPAGPWSRRIDPRRRRSR